jgi:hypothetical protein
VTPSVQGPALAVQAVSKLQLRDVGLEASGATVAGDSSIGAMVRNAPGALLVLAQHDKQHVLRAARELRSDGTGPRATGAELQAGRTRKQGPGAGRAACAKEDDVTTWFARGVDVR